MKLLKLCPMMLMLLACAGDASRSAAPDTSFPLSSIGGGLRDSTALACEPTVNPSDGYGRIRLVAPGPDSLLAWSDPATGQVMLQRGSGPLTVIGQSGSGLSFGLIAALGWAGDSLWVSDAMSSQIRWISTLGEELTTVTLPSATSVWVPRKGRNLGLAPRPVSSDEWALTSSTSAAAVDTLTYFTAVQAPRLRLPGMTEGDSVDIINPLANQTLVARSDDGSFWCSATGSGQDIQLHCVNDMGRTTLDTSVTIQPREVPGEVFDSLIGSMVTERGADLMGVLQALPPESPLPLVSRIRVDVSGDVWLNLAHSSDPMSYWLRLRRDGVVRDTLLLPSRLNPYGLRGDTIWTADSVGTYRQPAVLRCVLG